MLSTAGGCGCGGSCGDGVGAKTLPARPSVPTVILLAAPLTRGCDVAAAAPLAAADTDRCKAGLLCVEGGESFGATTVAYVRTDNTSLRSLKGKHARHTFTGCCCCFAGEDAVTAARSPPSDSRRRRCSASAARCRALSLSRASRNAAAAAAAAAAAGDTLSEAGGVMAPERPAAGLVVTLRCGGGRVADAAGGASP